MHNYSKTLLKAVIVGSVLQLKRAVDEEKLVHLQVLKKEAFSLKRFEKLGSTEKVQP